MVELAECQRVAKVVNVWCAEWGAGRRKNADMVKSRGECGCGDNEPAHFMICSYDCSLMKVPYSSQ